MIFENLSDIQSMEPEWKTKKTHMYKKLKPFFFYYEVFSKGKLVLFVVFVLLLQHPYVKNLLMQLFWLIRYMVGFGIQWIIP